MAKNNRQPASSVTKPAKPRHRLARPALALCATLLALLAAEGIVRCFGWAPGHKPIRLDAYDCIYQRSTNPILGFELKANYRCDDPDFIQTYERTNAHGQRDRERHLQKPAGVRRILLLGDSVVEGYSLRESETLSRQLEARYPDGATEVLNFGVSAYCTRAEIELLEVKGLRFEPDVVVLVFVENDFDNFNREAFPLTGTTERPAPVEVLFQRSHLFRLTSVRLNLFHYGAEVDPVRWNREAIGDNNVAEGLQRFRELADRHGFQPLVAIWPKFLDDRIADVGFMPGNDEQLVVEALAAGRGIPSVRFSKFFRQHHAESTAALQPRRYYSSGDSLHPSPAGARVAAAALKRMLDELDTGRISSVPGPIPVDAVAVAAARTLGQAQPNYARVHNRTGTEYLKQDKLAEAETAFKQALKADPSHAGAHNNLGVTYERMGRDGAQAEFERAIELQPDFTQARFNRSRLLMRKGQIDEAVSELRRTLQFDPDHVGALNMLGMALGRQRKFVEAQTYLEQAVGLDPNHAEARSNLGAAYAGQGRLQEAVTQFEAALRIDPDDPGARENLQRIKAYLQE
jgi:Flp pilus assembly protein TadD/lysophospholipase L1-like esterase